jgi:tetratricopeptide (TPR) repeat protein
VGGLTVVDYESLHSLPDPVKDLLPGIFQHLGPSVTVGDLVDGIRPDIVGELFVLDRLCTEPVVTLASHRLLGYAATTRPDAYRGFVERAVADHADHPQLLNLLKATGDGESTVADVELAVAVMQLLGRSDHPAIEWIFDQLQAAAAEGLSDEARHLTATARFKFASLVRAENGAQRAHDLYTAALADCDPTWPEYDSILNSRGITLLDLDRADAARADFSAVIESKFASAEIRACSLNNRADIFDDQEDLDQAIADRSAVLELAGTSYDRRYIALISRAMAFRKQGNNTQAHDDIITILNTGDIALEQKMQAKLIRAEWALEDGDTINAHADLDEIAVSYRNFDNVEKKVQELRH